MIFGGRRNTRQREAEGGFSLIEVMIAMHIITFAMLVMGGYMLDQLSVTGSTYAASIARSHAVEALEDLRRQRYSELASQATAPIPGTEGFMQTVTVQRVGGPESVDDYKIITVEVQPPGDLSPVRLTTAVAAL